MWTTTFTFRLRPSAAAPWAETVGPAVRTRTVRSAPGFDAAFNALLLALQHSHVRKVRGKYQPLPVAIELISWQVVPDMGAPTLEEWTEAQPPGTDYMDYADE
jgi:hypothetical protein